MEDNKSIADMVEVKGKIGRIENHMELLKKAIVDSDKREIENSKKLDLILNTFTDSPYNAENGFIKRINSIEKIVANHVLYWQILIGSLSAGSFLFFIVKVIFNIKF